MTFPVKLISWGGGQDALYAYLVIPLIGVVGLSPVNLRLPMLLTALATLPLAYLATRRIFGAGVALVAMFMLAISPWHVLMSRWALEANLLPFVFLAGFVSLLWMPKSGWWFVPACLLLALCLYAYGTAYVVIPVFMAGALLLIARERALRASQLWTGLAVFVLLAFPIGLLVILNSLGLDSVRLGLLTVPRFPVAPRWESVTVLGTSDVAGALEINAITSLRLLWAESDGISYNALEPYGIFYHLSLALALSGVALIVARRELNPGTRLLLLWLLAAGCVGVLSQVNINRFNIIFIPLIILGARTLHQIQGAHRALGPITVLALLGAFSAFTVSYHGEQYRGAANHKFQNGVIPALLAAQRGTVGIICVTDKINMPYIYALFTEPISPVEFQASVEYVDPAEPLRRVASFGRYIFGAANCRGVEAPTYVLTAEEIPPRMGNRYEYEFFDNFVVYSPRQ